MDMDMHMHMDLILDGLEELSSEQFQYAAWLYGNAKLQSSMAECVERLFGDSGLQDALDDGVVFAANVDDDLRKLVRLADEVDAQRSPRELIEDPLMIEVRALAGTIFRNLNRLYPGELHGLPAV